MKLIGSLALITALLPAPARAQCATFTHPFGELAGLDNYILGVNAIAGYDDGSGPAIFAGGVFGSGQLAPVRHLLKWNGTQWVSPLAPANPDFAPDLFGSNNVHALRAWDDGTGDALYAGGSFSAVNGVPAEALARCKGTTWSALGSGLTYAISIVPPRVNQLLPWDDGTGDALYVAGLFTHAGGVATKNIAKWNGTAWSGLGSGIDDGDANSLAVFDDGNGPALYVGGVFAHANGVSCLNIARWDGANFSPLGAGLNSAVLGLVAFDDGSGPALYARGNFTGSGSTSLQLTARWKNGQWSPVANNIVFSMAAWAVFDDGNGDALYGVGTRPPSPFWQVVQKLSGSNWVEVAKISYYPSSAETIDLGAGPELYVGGRFDRIGDALCTGVVGFDGQQWHGLGQGNGRGGLVETLTTHVSAGIPTLYADSGRSNGGAGDESVIAWDGASWHAVGEISDGDVHVLASHDDGTGSRLYAGGDFNSFGSTAATGVAMFDGVAWQPVGATAPSSSDTVWALQSWASPAGPRLVAGGEFVNLGSAVLGYIGAWNGAAWSALGGGMDERVVSLGTLGADLYAGGWFAQAGGAPANHIARWNGTQWSALGVGLDGTPWAITSFDDGSGPALYVGGEFTQAGGASAKHVARWNGTQWSAVGAGLNASVNKLVAFDDGSGPALFAAGAFYASGGAPTRFAARWNGAIWSAVDPTLNAEVFSMAVVDHASGESSLFLGGNFTRAGGANSLRVAEYERSFPCPPVAYCTAQTNSQACVPSIYATGEPSLSTSTFRVRATKFVNNKNGVMFWGLAPTAAPFHGGTKCIQAPTVRTPFQDSGGNGPPDDCSGTYAYFFGAGYMATSGLTAGERVYCQYWSRDPASASTTNLSDALTFLVAP